MHLEAFLGRETPFFGDFGGVSERNPPKIAARPGPALGLGPTPAPTPSGRMVARPYAVGGAHGSLRGRGLVVTASSVVA